MTDVEKWQAVLALIDELDADYMRPEGRWGMHGHRAVGDDYFAALAYCIDKLEAIRDA